MITLGAFFNDPWTGKFLGASTAFYGNNGADGANSGGTFRFQALDLTLSEAHTSAMTTIATLAGQLQAIRDGSGNADGEASTTGNAPDASKKSVADDGGTTSSKPRMLMDEGGDVVIALMPGGRVAVAVGHNAPFGGGGTDHMTSAGEIVCGLAAGGGSDTINVSAHVALSIYGNSVAGMDTNTLTADGNDIINIASNIADDINGGGGNDLINITAGWAAYHINGGAGDDVINIAAKEANFIRGGTGNDTITFVQTSDGAHVEFAKGDGRDTYNIAGRTRVDFLGGLSVKNVVTSPDEKTITLTFNESGDSITINYSGAKLSGDAPQVTCESGQSGLRSVAIS